MRRSRGWVSRITCWLFAGASLLAPLGAMGLQFNLEQVLFDRQVRPRSVVVAPGDLHAYAVSQERDAVALLERDGSGVFSVAQYLFDDRDGVNGLEAPTSVAVSPDGVHVYVGSGSSEGIAIFERDAVTGLLTFVDDDFIGASIEELAFHGNGFLYVTGGTFLAVFARNPATGGLTSVDFESDGAGGVDGLNGARGVTVTPDGLHVYVTGNFDGAVAIFSRAGDGTVTFVDAIFDDIDVDNIAGPYSVAASPDGDFIYVAGLADNALTAFARDSGTGLLTVIDEEIDDVGGVFGMRQPRKVLIPSDGAHVYTISAVDNSIVEFDRDAVNGLMTLASVTFEGGGDDGIRGVRDISATPNGSQLLTAGRGESEVGVFDRTAGDAPGWNHVAPLFDGEVEGLDSTSDMVLSHDQTSAYVVANTETLAHLDRDPATGQLSFVDLLADGQGGVEGLGAPQAVAISADDASVYTASWVDDSVSIFDRDAATGALSYVGSVVDGQGGVTGIDGAWSVTLSSDGSRLYAAGAIGDSLALFDRAPGTGDLSFVESYVNGTEGIEDLDFPVWLGLSGDGNSLYVVAIIGGIVVFDVDPLTGELTFVESHTVTELGGSLTALAVSPDGDNVYAVVQFGDFLLGFTRNAQTGALDLTQTLPGASVPGLDRGESIVVRPDGQRVYVGAAETLVALTRDTSTGELAFLETVADSPTGTEAASFVLDLPVSNDGSYLYGLSRRDNAISTFLTDRLFSDGFESGDTSAWSTTVP